MRTELKKQIIDWLFDNERVYNRLNKCVEKFRNYIYDNEGAYLIGGENVYEFIVEADTLLYKIAW